MSGVLGTRCFAGAEGFVHASQASANVHGEWVFAAEDAPGGPYRVLERREGLAEIVEGGALVPVERLRVIHPHPKRV